MFYEIVVAPGYTEKGLEVLQGKSKALRILEAELQKGGRRALRQIGGAGSCSNLTILVRTIWS